MALNRAIAKSLRRSNVHFLQVRLCSHGHSKGEPNSGNIRSPSKLSASLTPQRWIEQVPQTLLHIPVISGNVVSFPWLEQLPPSSRIGIHDGIGDSKDDTISNEAPSKKLLKTFEAPGSRQTVARRFGIDLKISTHNNTISDEALNQDPLKRFEASGSRQTAARLFYDNERTGVEETTHQVLHSFEVPESRKIAARLFQNIEARSILSKSHPAKGSASTAPPKRPCRIKPVISDHMVATLGSVENVVTLIRQFARVACEIASSETLEEKTNSVCCAVEDILGGKILDNPEIDLIVDAISEAQKNNMDQEISYLAAHTIRFLSFENVWQKLRADQKELLKSGLLSCQSDMLVHGVKAFQRSWQKLSKAQQGTASANLRSIAQSDFN